MAAEFFGVMDAVYDVLAVWRWYFHNMLWRCLITVVTLVSNVEPIIVYGTPVNNNIACFLHLHCISWSEIECLVLELKFQNGGN